MVEIKDFKTMLDNKSSIDEPIKNKQEPYEKPAEMSRNDNYTTGNPSIICPTKIITNSFVLIYQEKQTQVSLNKSILKEN